MLSLSTFSVDSFDFENDLISWEFASTTESLTNYSLSIYRSESPGGSNLTGFDIIASGISPNEVDSYIVAHSGYSNHLRTWYYKLNVINEVTEDTSAIPVIAGYAFSTQLDNAVTEILRRKKLSMDRASGKIGAGRTYYLLKRKTWGTHCSDCWNETLFRSDDPDCDTCYGTGWEGGYFNQIDFKGMARTSPKWTEINMFGDWMPSDTLLYLINYPLVKPKDIIVDDKGKRYIAVQIRPIEGLGRIIEQSVQLALVAVDDKIYEIDIIR